MPIADDLTPVIILVEPQLPENVGTTARAMANFGLSRLRLVNPRGGWPNDKARPAASGADPVLDAATAYPDLPSALADLRFSFATTSRPRGPRPGGGGAGVEGRRGGGVQRRGRVRARADRADE